MSTGNVAALLHAMLQVQAHAGTTKVVAIELNRHKLHVYCKTVQLCQFRCSRQWLSATADQMGLCFYSGVLMTTLPGLFRVSLERRDSTKGYVRSNVALVCLAFDVSTQWTKEIVILSFAGQRELTHRDESWLQRQRKIANQNLRQLFWCSVTVVAIPVLHQCLIYLHFLQRWCMTLRYWMQYTKLDP